MPLIDKVLPLIEGSDFYVSSNDLSELVVYSVQNGTVHKYASSVLMGSWQELDLTVEEFNIAQQDIIGIEGATFEDTDILILNKQDETRIIKMPETDVTYSPRSLYRLYWAYDTRKLYMNVADTWTTVGTMNHDLLDNTGSMTHTELEEAIIAIQEAIAGGVSADIIINEAGNWVINGEDTGNPSRGIQGPEGPPGEGFSSTLVAVSSVNNVLNLTKDARQHATITANTTIVLPTPEVNEYLEIEFLFYADSAITLVFEDDIKWSSRPSIQAGMSYTFSFKLVNNVWWGTWYKLSIFDKDYIYKAGDTCDVLTGGYTPSTTNLGFVKNEDGKLTVSASGLYTWRYFASLAVNTTINATDLTNYAKLYVDLGGSVIDGGSIKIKIGSLVVFIRGIGTLPRGIIEIDLSTIIGTQKISFYAESNTSSQSVATLNIYNAWLEKNEFVDTPQEIFTTPEKNKLTGISTGANKVVNSTTNGNILIDGVETNVYAPPTGTNPGVVTYIQPADNILQLTKNSRQYVTNGTLLTGTTIKLPTMGLGDYLQLILMFYAESDLSLVFDDNISWSSDPVIRLNKRYIFNFEYIEGEWWATWILLNRANLIKNILIGWYIDETTGQQLAEPLNEHCTIDYISVNPSTSYTMSAGQIWYLRYAFYDANKVFISGVIRPRKSPNDVIIVTPINARYIRLSLSRVNSNGDGSATSTWRFEMGPIA